MIEDLTEVVAYCQLLGCERNWVTARPQAGLVLRLATRSKTQQFLESIAECKR
jgi:hypothetical protein